MATALAGISTEIPIAATIKDADTVRRSGAHSVSSLLLSTIILVAECDDCVAYSSPVRVGVYAC